MIKNRTLGKNKGCRRGLFCITRSNNCEERQIAVVTVKIALDSRKLNDSCTKMRAHMPNMEELLNPISVEITRDRTVQIFISKIDLDYANGQMKLSEETSRQSVFALTGGN